MPALQTIRLQYTATAANTTHWQHIASCHVFFIHVATGGDATSPPPLACFFITYQTTTAQLLVKLLKFRLEDFSFKTSLKVGKKEGRNKYTRSRGQKLPLMKQLPRCKLCKKIIGK